MHMKVAQINAVCEFGSTGKIVADISDRLDEKGINNIIIFSSGSTNRKNALKMSKKIDTKLHALFSRIFGMQGYFSKKSTKNMIKYLEQYSPDIIHLHNLHGNYINLKMLFEYIIKNDIATVITLHDCFFFTGKCVYYSLVECNKWQLSCGNCSQLESGNPSWFFDKTAKMLKDKQSWYRKINRLGVIGVSHWITGEAEKSILSCAKTIRTVYNWIDLKTFRPHDSDIKAKLGIKDKIMVLGVAISWIDEKGINDFNKLAEMLDNKFKIVLVGKKTGYINDKILHIDRTSDVIMLADLYADADVFFNPTRRETFGKVTAEALASGTPVITYNTTACTELVNHDCGFVEKIGDIKSVYKDILEISDNKKQYITLCRQFAERNFDKNIKIDEIISIYKELIK